jgi:hypothetical protein
MTLDLVFQDMDFSEDLMETVAAIALTVVLMLCVLRVVVTHQTKPTR